ncbi:hypothetical protein O181_106233 [Austropuccinia psidii MF-1]|uniref:Uncharacterized protein n=1 Tax=Austropuccinia psidii MF-1 TaxID=1389203 RepID=A0A9Q3JQF0_9BASI|nr:hypothetical protein [Austropuccinia psidii MF-1]
MSSVKAPSHPFEITTISKILEESPIDLATGQLYANFNCDAAISCAGLNNDDPKDIRLNVSANTSRPYAFVARNIYSMKLRLVKSASGGTFTGYYVQNQPALLGDIENIDVYMTNKIVADSFGMIIERSKIPAGSKGNNDPFLMCTVKHTDWDNEVSTTIKFVHVFNLSS